MKYHLLASLLLLSLVAKPIAHAAEPYPHTEPLTWEGDLAARMVEGADRFLLRKIDESADARAAHWNRDFTSAEAYDRSIEPNRQRLAHILGLREERPAVAALELVATTVESALVGKGRGFHIHAVRWPALRNIQGEGLLLVPDDERHIGVDVVAIPDADQTPEQIVGLVEGVARESQFARRLAESGCRVLVPVLVSREMKRRAPPGQAGRANLTNREYLYRSAYELGRHLIGYELHKVLAAVDWFERQAEGENSRIGVVGYGEGGMLAMYAGALDTRIDTVCVSGYFGPREGIWRQPISRNVFGLLEQFGDAEIASLIAPRSLVVDAHEYPQVTLPSEGGAPAELAREDPDDVSREFDRLHRLTRKFASGQFDSRLRSDRGHDDAFFQFLSVLTNVDGESRGRWQSAFQRAFDQPQSPEWLVEPRDPAPRQQRQVDAIDEHNQWLLGESSYTRAMFMNIGLPRDDRSDGENKLDTSSPENYEKSLERFRDHFRHEVVGHFDDERLAFNARSRRAYEEELWTGYEVVLDVFPDVFAYGILCVPKGIEPGERRPVVVCQHGLEGRPQQVVAGNHRAYHDFAAKLAERGFITFSPQNLYIGHDNFRTLQRKAYPLKKTLFSVIVPQHQQIVDWLKSLEIVDAERIAFYGLSYGGKSAMRIPPLVSDYCLSICSADFNEWVWKNASTRAPYSYIWTGEYEIFEFDLGSTFNYAEMAALIAPRPFMVERGHFDGVAPDEMVGYEFAKVRHLYAARLNLPARCEIEWFVGPHTIHGEGTFDFLHKHLRWPK